MAAVRYQHAGSYDADFEAAVTAGGVWSAEGGSYVTRGRQSRSLTRPERAALARLVAAAEAVPSVTAALDGAAFASTLTVGARSWHWAGPPPAGPLAALVRWLEAPAGR